MTHTDLNGYETVSMILKKKPDEKKYQILGKNINKPQDHFHQSPYPNQY